MLLLNLLLNNLILLTASIFGMAVIVGAEGQTTIILVSNTLPCASYAAVKAH
jgi:hypothetical protein